MYKISVSPPVQRTLQGAVVFLHQLKMAAPHAWDDFKAPETDSIRAQWGKIETAAVGDKPMLGAYLTGTQLRNVARALSVYVAAQDGRYSLLSDYLTCALRFHPDPCMLMKTFADAEVQRLLDSDKARPMSGLTEADDAEVRQLLAELMTSMTPPGQALAIDLPAFGIVKFEENELEPC